MLLSSSQEVQMWMRTLPIQLCLLGLVSGDSCTFTNPASFSASRNEDGVCNQVAWDSLHKRYEQIDDDNFLISTHAKWCVCYPWGGEMGIPFSSYTLIILQLRTWMRLRLLLSWALCTCLNLLGFSWICTCLNLHEFACNCCCPEFNVLVIMMNLQWQKMGRPWNIFWGHSRANGWRDVCR